MNEGSENNITFERPVSFTKGRLSEASASCTNIREQLGHGARSVFEQCPTQTVW